MPAAPSPNTLRNFLVGLVFLGSLAILGWVTLSLDAVPWVRARSIEVRFPRINNLRTGDDVLLNGYRIGQVEAIRYDPDPEQRGNDIVVACSLFEDIPLTENTEFTIRSSSALGGRFVEITPRSGRPVGYDWRGFAGEAESDFQESLNRIVGDLREGRGLLARLLNDEKLASDFASTLTAFREATAAFQEGRGLLPRLVSDEQLAQDVTSLVESLKRSGAELESGRGLLPRLLRDEELADRVSEAVEDISSGIRERKGILGMLINDPEARDDLRSAIADVRSVTADIREGKGLAGRLVSDSALADEVAEAVEDAHDVLHKANTGEGTLGQVVNNRQAWEELVRILTLAREAIEDLREQAPINTFANVLFAAF